ncbi:unnamed protein product [Taenia asiatica]|uniref:J domain-containing protein n=1 Tax=Taenia asiatica TaxID=60517 RepID=A0A0R3VUQ9_TAEAS|nr:unnamed protein product [Taenia asiatica]
MGVDYYYLLGVTESATLKDLHRAYITILLALCIVLLRYRRQALRFHPLRNKQLEADNLQQFTWISEAYEVLKDPILRARYDQYGEAGLKHGIPGVHTEPVRYLYHGDPYKTFQEYFGDWNPFKEFTEEMTREQMENFGRKDGRGQIKKAEPTIVKLMLTLEELYNGCIKKMTVKYTEFDKDCQTTEIKEKTLTMAIRAGFREGASLIFKEEGNQGPNVIPGDVIFVVTALEHPFFRREGINLYHTEKIHVGQALLGCVVEIPTLDGRILHVAITNIIKPDYVKVVKGEGIPDSCNPKEKGDLYISFDIIYPDKLTRKERINLEAALFREGEPLQVLT